MTTSYTVGHSNNDRPSRHTAARPGADDKVAPLSGRAGLLISIQPRYAKRILDGQKQVELRRRPPRSQPAVAVIYSSGSDRSVLGTARIKAIHTASPAEIWQDFSAAAGVTRDEFDVYFSGCNEASALELVSPRRATHRLPLADLRALGLEPPQSWRYINAEQLETIVGFLRPQRTMNRDDSSPRTRPLGRAWQGVNPLAAFGLRCMTIGFRQRGRSSDQTAPGKLDYTMPAPRCHSTPGPRSAGIREDL